MQGVVSLGPVQTVPSEWISSFLKKPRPPFQATTPGSGNEQSTGGAGGVVLRLSVHFVSGIACTGPDGVT